MAAACALLSAAEAPLSPEAAAALELLGSVAVVPANALQTHPQLARRVGTLVTADAHVPPLRALTALLRCSPREVARDAAAQLHDCGALTFALEALAAPLEHNVAAMQLVEACAAAQDDAAPHAAALRHALVGDVRPLQALIGALGGAGEPRVSASAASCVAALARAFPVEAVERLCQHEAVWTSHAKACRQR